MSPGDRLTLAIDRPAAGGRMIARHEGAVVLVSASIPGETVEAEVEKVQRGTVWARTLRVVTPSPDRIEPDGDWSCGGNVLAHIAYERQVSIKREIIRDAFRRIGRLDTPEDLPVMGSPVAGYRMRARLHVAGGRIGFFREGTHQLCEPAQTGQLLPATVAVLSELSAAVAAAPHFHVSAVELSENCPANERALHVVLSEGTSASRVEALHRMPGVTGVSYASGYDRRPVVLWGTPEVSDEIVIPATAGAVPVRVTRQAHAFFQGNRFLLAPLAAAVTDSVPPGRVLELYAGVGLFAVTLAARGGTSVVAVEGDRTAAADLKTNAERVGRTIEPRSQSVERFLESAPAGFDTVIVDPPRTGMTKDASRGVIALGAPRVVYVSCDVATLARDARMLADAGYEMRPLRAFDLFPNTAHVETLAVFERA